MNPQPQRNFFGFFFDFLTQIRRVIKLPLRLGILTVRMLIIIYLEFFPASSGPSFEIWMQDRSTKLFRSNWSQERYNYSLLISNTSGFSISPEVYRSSLNLSGSIDGLYNIVVIWFIIQTMNYGINHRWNGHEPRDKLIACLKIKKTDVP